MGSRHLAGPAFAGAVPTPFEQVAAGGIAVASADYRLSGEAQWPAQLHDAKAAVRWLRARAGELGIDGERIARLGRVGGRPPRRAARPHRRRPRARGRPRRDRPVEPGKRRRRLVRAERPQGDGHRHRHRPHGPGHARGPAAGRAPAAVPDAAAQASPVTHVSPGAPPFLLLHGSADRLVPCVQSERFHHALQAAGVAAELTSTPALITCGPARPGPRSGRWSRRSAPSASGCSLGADPDPGHAIAARGADADRVGGDDRGDGEPFGQPQRLARARRRP